MGTRNFGMGSRDMAWAGDMALKTQSGLSFSGIATVSERWGEFCKWAQVEGIKKMENVTRETLIKYGNGLASKVLSGEFSAATAQNYVSAANQVMGIARGDNAVSVSPTRDCGIPKRSGIATEIRAIGEKEHEAPRAFGRPGGPTARIRATLQGVVPTQRQKSVAGGQNPRPCAHR